MSETKNLSKLELYEAEMEKIREKIKKEKEKVRSVTGKKFLDTFGIEEEHQNDINSLIENLHELYLKDQSNQSDMAQAHSEQI